MLKLAKQARLQKGSREIPAKYQWHSQVFSEEAAQHFPESQIWDHIIELKPNALSMIPGKVYQLTQVPMWHPSSSSKRKMANYDQSKTTNGSMSGLSKTATHCH